MEIVLIRLKLLPQDSYSHCYSQTIIVQDLHEPLEPGVEFMPLTFDLFLLEETKVPLSKPQIS